ncbi:OLC1v1032009C1 [Oldenlandia corymbosa var. corymbosa]|uniref:OLC1v1032009C1 n=1 Tax=Oldenlandia corymbosa var. corymbosa TaxID=529605 RepID=A0AAV1CKK5_OLDCO|nr:OLC1v1032009C1 [Oldenlandia corymbosa var. corymbosa]
MFNRPAVAIFLLLGLVITPSMIQAQLPGTGDVGENKCGGCPCNSPCYTSPPPPPPPSPPPPPKKPPTSYCPPPPGSIVPFPPTPPSQYIYITGPPGDVYPVDHDYGKAGRSSSATVGLTALFIVLSILQLAV